MSTEEATAQPPQQQPQQAKRKPGWMSLPGGPKEPNRNDFHNKLNKFNDEKTKCFDRLKEIRGHFDTEAKKMLDDDTAPLRQRIREIEELQRTERDKRRGKDDEIKKYRGKRRDLEIKLKELTQDLGAFNNLSDIEEAIDRVLFRMETGTDGTLKSEKATLKRLNQLESAKHLIHELQPLEEEIGSIEGKEYELQQEYREIHEKLSFLNKEYEEQVKTRKAVDQTQKKTGIDRQALGKEREVIRARIGTLNEDLSKLRGEFDEGMNKWNAWKVEAQTKYRTQMEEQRKDRERKYLEREAQRKLERRRHRAAKKLNPYAEEIECCLSLIHYLEEKVKNQVRDAQRAEQRKKVAAFDATKAAPKGAVLRQGDDLDKNDWLSLGKKKNEKKQQEKKEKPAINAEQQQEQSSKKAEQKKDAANRYVQHPVERYRSFEIVKLDVPLTFAQIPDVLDQLRKKRKEFEAHIKEPNLDDPEFDSDNEEEDEEEGEDKTRFDTTSEATTANVKVEEGA